MTHGKRRLRTALTPVPGDDLLALGVLRRYLLERGMRLYPRELAFIESPQKSKHFLRAFGKAVKTVATKGYFMEISTWSHCEAPQWRTTDPVVLGHLEASLEDVNHIDRILIATDDDSAGEEIAWHLSRLIASRAPDLLKKTFRMRFDQLDPQTLIMARNQASTGIDHDRVRSSVIKRLADRRFIEHVEGILGVRLGRSQIASANYISEQVQTRKNEADN